MEKKLVNDLQKELHLKATELFHINVFLKSSECFMDLFLMEKKKNLISKYIIKNNNNNNNNNN